MTMAPLPQNNTHRMFFDYVTGNTTIATEHTMAVRYNPALRDVSDVQVDFLNFLQAITNGNLFQGWRVLRCRVQAAGSDFSLPVTVVATLASFVGTGAATPAGTDEAKEWTWQGRSNTTGRRVDISMYGISAAFPANFRFPAGGSSPAFVANTVNVLNAKAILGSFLTIDGSPPTYYSYVNGNFNSYWERRLRSV